MTNIASYHKTGTHLLRHIFKRYRKLDKSFRYHFNSHFNLIPPDKVSKSKNLVIIRNPFEIIISACNYHHKAKEPGIIKKGKTESDGYCWYLLPDKNKTYAEHLKSLKNMDEKIIFEMNNKAKITILNIYIDIITKNQYSLFIHLEDFYTKEGREKLAKNISKYLNINYEKLLNSINKCSSVKFNCTNPTNDLLYKKLFKKCHYDAFYEIFPKDILEVFGYTSLLK